jgi:hypothetical protein
MPWGRGQVQATQYVFYFRTADWFKAFPEILGTFHEAFVKLTGF